MKINRGISTYVGKSIIENYNNMTSKIAEQAKRRVDELPKGTVQKVVIDARGQKLTAENIFFIK